MKQYTTEISEKTGLGNPHEHVMARAEKVLAERSFGVSDYPYNDEIENSLLGFCLSEDKLYGDLEGIVSPEMFFFRKNQLIFSAIQFAYKKHGASDLMFVVDRLQDMQHLNTVGGLYHLTELMERACVGIVNFREYAVLLREKYLRRNYIDFGRKLIEMGRDTMLPLEDVINQAESTIYTLSNFKPSSTYSSYKIESIVEKAFESIINGIPTYKTGYTNLDNLIVGLEPATLTVVGGRASMGKTVFATNLALQMADLHKKPALYFSLEMTKEQILHRLFPTVSMHPAFKEHWVQPITLTRIKNSNAYGQKLTQDEQDNLALITHALSLVPLEIIDDRSITVGGIASYARRASSEYLRQNRSQDDSLFFPSPSSHEVGCPSSHEVGCPSIEGDGKRERESEQSEQSENNSSSASSTSSPTQVAGGLSCIIVDYAQLFASSEENRTGDASETSAIIGKVARRLYQLAQELDCPVILLSQINRGVEGRNDKRPNMSDLSESGKLEQIADNIILLYRDSYYNQTGGFQFGADAIDILEAIVRKCRSGETGTAKLGINLAYQLIYNLSDTY